MVLVLEILVQGPGKSWNFLMMCEADTMIQVQIYGFLWPRKIEKALSFREASPLTPPPPCSFWTICLLFLSDSDQCILEYGFSDSTQVHVRGADVWCIYMVSNCCSSLYLYISGIRNASGVLEKSWKFLSPREWEPCTKARDWRRKTSPKDRFCVERDMLSYTSFVIFQNFRVLHYISWICISVCVLCVVSVSWWWWRGGFWQHCQRRSAISSTSQYWGHVNHETGTTSCFLYDHFCLSFAINCSH